MTFCSTAGSYRIIARQGNSAELYDLTGGKYSTVDVFRLKLFFAAPSLDIKAVAGANLGEAQVDAVLAHRGHARKRGTGVPSAVVGRRCDVAAMGVRAQARGDFSIFAVPTLDVGLYFTIQDM